MPFPAGGVSTRFIYSSLLLPLPLSVWGKFHPRSRIVLFSLARSLLFYRPLSFSVAAKVQLLLRTVGEEKLEQARSLCFGLLLAEVIGRSKGLGEINPPPDTQDEALTYTCCIDSEQ